MQAVRVPILEDNLKSLLNDAMTNPLISVLIDTYNYGHFVEEAVDSVLSQDVPPEQMEVLVVDDGSTDDTAQRVKKYGTKVRYLRKENGGQASAFNFGLAEARGAIVALLDADDYWLPGKLRRVLAEFQAHPEAGVMYHRLAEADTAGSLREARFAFTAASGLIPADRGQLLAFQPHQTSALAFRRELLNRLLPIPENLRVHADAFLELTAILLAPAICVPEKLAVYRIHGKNLTYADWVQSGADAARRRYFAYGPVITEVWNWIKAHQRELNRIDTRGYLAAQFFELKTGDMLARGSSRLSLFWFLMRKNHACRLTQSPQFTIFNYLSALVTLILGYKSGQAISERTLLGVQRLLRKGTTK
jgi:glycosyltransferase involved in cell wall biosynthesis